MHHNGEWMYLEGRCFMMVAGWKVQVCQDGNRMDGRCVLMETGWMVGVPRWKQDGW